MAPRRKKVKRSGGTSSQRATDELVPPASPKGILQLPFDLQFEILWRLHPRDLLNMARTDKAHRVALLNKRTMLLAWRKSFENAEGVPAVVPGFSHPAFAAVLFTDHCNNCGRAADNLELIPANCATLCPMCKIRLTIESWSRVDKFEEKLKEKAPYTRLRCLLVFSSREVKASWGNYTVFLYPRDQFLDLEAKLEELTDDEFKNYVVKQQKWAAQLQPYVNSLVAWAESAEAQKAERVKLIRDGRADQIIQRLCREGWSDEVDKDPAEAKRWIKQHDKDLQPRPTITDSEWRRAGKGFRDVMMGLHQGRLRSEWTRRWHVRMLCLVKALDTYREGRWAPRAGYQLIGGAEDYAFHPKIQRLLNLPSPRPHREVGERAPGRLPRPPRALLQAHDIPIADDVTDPTTLAVVTFDCTECKATNMRFPAVLGHKGGRCLFGGDADDTAADLLCDPEHQIRVQFCERFRGLLRHADGERPRCYQLDRLTLSAAAPSACAVVAACRLDPSRATVADVEANKARMRCTVCTVAGQGWAYDWAAAVRHDLEVHNLIDDNTEDKPVNPAHWQGIHPSLRDPILRVEAAIAQERSQNANAGPFHCTWCGEFAAKSAAVLVDHVKVRHRRQRARRGADFARERLTPQVWLFRERPRDTRIRERVVVVDGEERRALQVDADMYRE
ncbi:uncharacterized protein BXZ73DRAFT_97833 [Epithele typhae]|uniref:uncharacterized protein n=1 Tax=Epithele typhae TaxID=378194 RepID=UPI002008CB00|nr:uncharacterized protein BXZ73DRAFT_97833 [Epithele typhae]KAH9942421.1 hypothetical protein BXZ73DRAFT_97833 [Epithele typhae]